MTTAITLQQITKNYKLYAHNRDRLNEALNPFCRAPKHTLFSALDGIDATIERGEIVALIGMNGSGKSTLLKIITGVLSPSSGLAKIDGRINAMLELGAGLNPELNGEENIFFSLSLLGIGKKAALLVIDDIKEFAELDEFIHQPVKTYSSGMKARLAFAIASHSSPEVLIVDEVLSVGDARFRQKSTRKMRELMEGDTTVLFVSHDMHAVKNLCTRALWLHKGQLKMDGETRQVVEAYTGFMESGHSAKAPNRDKPAPVPNIQAGWIATDSLDSYGSGTAKISRVQITHADGSPVTTLSGGEELFFEAEIKCTTTIHRPGFGFLIKDRVGNELISVNNYTYDQSLPIISADTSRRIRLKLRFPHLKNGTYLATVALSDGTQEEHQALHWIYDCLIVKVHNPGKAYQRTGFFVLPEAHVHFSAS